MPRSDCAATTTNLSSIRFFFVRSQRSSKGRNKGAGGRRVPSDSQSGALAHCAVATREPAGAGCRSALHPPPLAVFSSSNALMTLDSSPMTLGLDSGTGLGQGYLGIDSS